MSVKETAARQYRRIIDDAGERFGQQMQPKQGWLMTFRKALNMSGPQLARRTGVTKAAIYQAERKELAGEITVKQLQKLASAMGGKLVYAIVPETQAAEDLIREQALRKATAIIGTANMHMALESQALSAQANLDEIQRLSDELTRNPPPDFWEGP